MTVVILCGLASLESSCLGVQLKVRSKLFVRLNITPRPIANKYSDGKLKRTLKREFKSTWNCIVVNGGVIEVWIKDSSQKSKIWLHFFNLEHNVPFRLDVDCGWSLFDICIYPSKLRMFHFQTLRLEEWWARVERECHLWHCSPNSVVSRSSASLTRLETRTKESNMCASRWVY